MQAIHTKYLGPTNHRGARIVARSQSAISVTVPYDHALDLVGNHRAAAQTLCDRLEWTGQLEAGALPDGSYAHVFIPKGGG